MSGKPNTKWMETMLAKHGSREAVREVQRAIGAKGGRNGNTGGFAANPELASIAGRIGGLKSKRRSSEAEKELVEKKQQAAAEFQEQIKDKIKLDAD